MHQIWVPPSKRAVSATVAQLARERLQVDTDLLRIITSNADSFPGVPTSMTLNDLERQK